MVTLPLTSGLMYQNCHLQNILQSTVGAVQNGLKVQLGGEPVATFKTASTAAAAKIKACHHPLQVTDVTIQIYPALQLMRAKVLPIKFRG